MTTPYEQAKQEHFELLCTLEADNLKGGGLTDAHLYAVAGVFHNEGFEKGYERGKKSQEPVAFRPPESDKEIFDMLSAKLAAAKLEIERLKAERTEVTARGNVAYLWFGGKDGWQVTSFHPKDDPAIGYKASKMYVNYAEHEQTRAIAARLAEAIKQELHAYYNGSDSEQGHALLELEIVYAAYDAFVKGESK